MRSFASRYAYFAASYGAVLAFMYAVPPPRLPGYVYGYLQLIAVLASAWGGFGPGILASITWVVIIPRVLGQSPTNWEPGRLALQIIVCLLVSWTGQRRRRAESNLRQTNDHLEQRVAERSEKVASTLSSLQAEMHDRAAAETTLRESEKRYSTLAEALPAIIFTALPDGRTDYINRRWHEYTGLTQDTPDWAAVVHPDDYERTQNAWLAAMQTGSPYDTELRLQRTDHIYRWFKIQARPWRDDHGRIIKWLGIYTDIDDQKKTDERLRESQKLEAMGRLAGGVAHDFNNLLTAICGYNALVMEQVHHDAALREYTQEVEGAATRATELTQQLLAFSRHQVAQVKHKNILHLILFLKLAEQRMRAG